MNSSQSTNFQSLTQYDSIIQSSQHVYKSTDSLEAITTNLISALDIIEKGLESMPVLKYAVQGLKEVLKRVVVCHPPNIFSPFSHCATD